MKMKDEKECPDGYEWIQSSPTHIGYCRKISKHILGIRKKMEDFWNK
jgi:hypothetical protein